MTRAEFLLPSAGEAETRRLGRRIASLLPPATVVGLVGPLGAGKTAIARALAEGFGVNQREVVSPTFVYLVEYEASAGPVVHADLYRLSELPEATRETEIANLGLVEAFDAATLTMVEWWDYYVGPEPPLLLVITVEFVPGKADHRTIRLAPRGLDIATFAAAFGPEAERV